jgi:hypothetical protein
MKFALHELDIFDEMSTIGFLQRIRYCFNIILITIAIFSDIKPSIKTIIAYDGIDEIDKYLKYLNIYILNMNIARNKT